MKRIGFDNPKTAQVEMMIIVLLAGALTVVCAAFYLGLQMTTVQTQMTDQVILSSQTAQLNPLVMSLLLVGMTMGIIIMVFAGTFWYMAVKAAAYQKIELEKEAIRIRRRYCR